jgi:hypothetical protein
VIVAGQDRGVLPIRSGAQFGVAARMKLCNALQSSRGSKLAIIPARGTRRHASFAGAGSGTTLG